MRYVRGGPLSLLADLKSGKRGAVAKAISSVENGAAGSRALMKSIFRDPGDSVIIGITGPAGSGKSSLINRAAIELGRLGARPAVLAVDPTSHLTGGAILGDRVRMAESADSGTYIRSIASRGATGAVSAHVRDITRVLEYAGFNPVIIESVGAGQTEVEISRIADITVVVFNPHTGDGIQAVKAGITEIGDICVVNKGDLPGAQKLQEALKEFVGSDGGPPVLMASAKTGSGVKALARMLYKMMEAGARREGRLEEELRGVILNNIKERIDSMLDADETYQECLKKVRARRMDPREAAEKVARKLVG
ncbi:periplasmic protein kinase ArgK [Cenarchaeum symbiosum A]|uniref:Periplasmic protein kinase ArgK n=1 Tax=Cenarchaeum symbiosum (strain A) TaxID=414004 RepID=A0RUU4_CENSY|nr:periplasmic protein kinase ArgK [Cenarchaeum symbiosum A]